MNTIKKTLKTNSRSEIFNLFLSSLAETNIEFDFFVDWGKIKQNLKRFEFEIGILNTIVGSKKPSLELSEAIKKYPKVARVIPLLIATRKRVLKVLEKNPPTYLFHF